MQRSKSGYGQPPEGDSLDCPVDGGSPRTSETIRNRDVTDTQNKQSVGLYCRISGLALSADVPHFRCQRCRETYLLKYRFEEQPMCQDCAQRSGLTRLLLHEREGREKYIDESLQQRLYILKEDLLSEMRKEIRMQLENVMVHQENEKRAMEDAIEQAVRKRMHGMTPQTEKTPSPAGSPSVESQHKQDQDHLRETFNAQLEQLSADLQRKIDAVFVAVSQAPEMTSVQDMQLAQLDATPSEKVTLPLREKDFVTIPPGTFMMGEAEKEQRVAISGFQLQITPVTFAQFDDFCDQTGRTRPSDSGWGRGQRPVMHVSYWDAVDFCEWLSEHSEYTYRLPTEAEWEYACRAGTSTRFWYGSQPDLNKMHCSQENIGDAARTLPVGHFPPNPWGLYDTHGNVWEWCASIYNSQYNGAEELDASLDRNDDRDRVLRGGAWLYTQALCRSACRYTRWPDGHNNNIGFRAARTLD
ncbi:formylglycine-generating enzyme family protein [Pontibacter sp. JAM-7]|uniref:formylglycine-generating enzyme family protein n=1 Tax=Pontibacter sp. JAM-7 TaxID=3366581 RepID=UPI003AF4D798